MTEVTTDFAISYLLDDCDICPEKKGGKCMTQSHCFEVKQMAIKALRQEPKTGHWIALENRFKLGDRLKCSECGQVFVVGDEVSRNYCPNCGAKMEREDKG